MAWVLAREGGLLDSVADCWPDGATGRRLSPAMTPPRHASQARLVVLGFLCALTFVLYLDRVCIAQALVPIQEELDLSNTQMSWVLMAFHLPYGLCGVPPRDVV